jgi:glucokinase
MGSGRELHQVRAAIGISARFTVCAMRGGIDLGGTKIEAVIVDDGNQVIGQARRSTPTEGGPDGVTEQMAAALREAATAAGIELSELVGVGVGSPGSVDAKAGTVAKAGNLPAWQEPFALAAALTSSLGAPIRLGNDVGVAVEAEAALGAGRRYGSFLGLWWGTGVGGAIFVNGKPWLGRGGAGEIGHTVVRLGGARCPCGRRGCVEAYAGRNAMELRARRARKNGQKTKLFRIMEEKGHPRLTSGVWQDALTQNDKLAERLIARAVSALAAGAASAVNLIDVEAVVVGGGLGTRLGEPIVDRLRAAMLPHLFRDDRPPEVVLAALGDLAGAVGAARLVNGTAGTAPRGRDAGRGDSTRASA